jgi:large subunit ribosomal protein L35e
MKIQKGSELRKMSKKELQDKLADLRSEMSKLNAAAGRGTLKKESGGLKVPRRNIARIITVIHEKERESVE